MNVAVSKNDQQGQGDESTHARQAHIKQVRRKLVDTYLASWDRMIQQWSADDTPDAIWLMHAANYLARTDGVRWAIDPLRLGQRLPEAPDPNVADLGALDFVLLTHLHCDHIDQQLWRALRERRRRPVGAHAGRSG